MLILSRRPDEAIRIGNDIVLTVLEVTGKAVRIGVDAPRDFRVDRAEVASGAVPRRAPGKATHTSSEE